MSRIRARKHSHSRFTCCQGGNTPRDDKNVKKLFCDEKKIRSTFFGFFQELNNFN